MAFDPFSFMIQRSEALKEVLKNGFLVIMEI
jgi:hypothetical protein